MVTIEIQIITITITQDFSSKIKRKIISKNDSMKDIKPNIV